MINKPYIALFLSIVSVSFAAIFIVTLEKTFQTNPLTISFYRLFFTTLLICPYVILNKKIHIEIKQLSSRQLILLIGIGLILAAHFALWITSLQMTSVASSVILVTAHPILVAPLALFFLKEKLRPIHIFGILLSVTGVIFLVYGNYGWSFSSIDTLPGNILAMLGGVAAGLYILGGRSFRKTTSLATYVFIVYSFGSIALFFICIGFSAPLIEISIDELGIIFGMAIIAGIFGHTMYNWSLKHVRASLASVVLLGEPIGSTILAFILPWIHQVPSYFTIIGGGIILIGIYLTSRKTYNEDFSNV